MHKGTQNASLIQVFQGVFRQKAKHIFALPHLQEFHYLTVFFNSFNLVYKLAEPSVSEDKLSDEKRYNCQGIEAALDCYAIVC